MFCIERHLVSLQMLQAVRHGYKNVMRNFSSTRPQLVGYKLKNDIKDCYSLLNMTEESSMEEIKGAYFKLAKMYHPDSASSVADQRKFDQVKEAYQSIKAHREETENLHMFYGADDDDDDDDFDMTKLQPQHRPYLEHQGIGYGTPSERRKQYDQHRVSKAVTDISKYRIRKITSTDQENSLVVKDKKAARKAKISNTMDRLVEDLIQESMNRGEFDNLSGLGKPLNFNQASPYTDRITEKLNNIMIDSGVQPEWILLNKEIRMDVQQFRERFAIEKKLLGSDAYTEDMEKQLQYHANKLKMAIEDTNVKIKKFNLIVPLLNKQMMPYNYNREYVNIFKHPDRYLPDNFDLNFYRKIRGQGGSSKVITGERPDWRGVWDDFKGIFKSS